MLVSYFLNELLGKDNNPSIEKDALSMLFNYDYPGNIRELRSMMESAVNLAQGRKISKIFFPDTTRKQKPKKKPVQQPGAEPVISLAQMERLP